MYLVITFIISYHGPFCFPFLIHYFDGDLCSYKVEDYYEIIEEPMDFGTMRAKLHEGMYQSLEQFEVCFFLYNYLSELDMKLNFFFPPYMY